MDSVALVTSWYKLEACIFHPVIDGGLDLDSVGGGCKKAKIVLVVL